MGQICINWWQATLTGIAIVYLVAAFFFFILLLIAAKGKIGKEDSFLSYIKVFFLLLGLPAAFIIGLLRDLMRSLIKK